MSRTATTAKRAAKGKQKETAGPTPVIRTKNASRKPTISFTDQQKENVWKYNLVLSWTIVVKYHENNTTKAVLETALGQIFKYLKETTGRGKNDAFILP